MDQIRNASFILFISVILLSTTTVVADNGNNNIDDSGRGHHDDPPKRNTICIPGLNTWGAISPRGDPNLEVGDTLEVNCTIDRSSPEVGNMTSADIEFSFKKHDIPDQQMEVNIIDESTAMLRVKNMNVSTPLLYCSLVDRHNNNSHVIHVCQSQINVGYPPLDVENFRCVARNWESLNCTWTKPFNPVDTNYEMMYRYKAFSFECRHVSKYKQTFSCEWNGMTEPHYRPSLEYYDLVINGSNILKPDGVLFQHRVHVWALVIPGKPDKVITEALSAEEIQVSWEFVNYESFRPGLMHRVTICAAEHDVVWCMTKNFTSRYVSSLTERIHVPYAFMNYSVEVSMKSKVANDTEDFWSAPGKSYVQTLEKKPDSPPHTTPGGFQVFNQIQTREVLVYWQNIEPWFHNGSDFHLNFTVYENGQRRNDINATEVTSSFAVFTNMSMQAYRFEISSVNAKGRSERVATVYVPSNPPKGPSPPAPQSVTKMLYSNGTYEVSWKPPSQIAADEILSYTIFVCNGSRLSPLKCNVLLDWKEVPADQTMWYYNDLSPQFVSTVFQFGVSVNTKTYGSSAMVLAHCELVFNQVPTKITDVRIGTKTSTTMKVVWNPDCDFKPGRIDGFKITYCLVTPSSSDSCIDMERNKKEVRVLPEVSDFTLQNLEPFSKYLVAIHILTRAGESAPSNSVFGITEEAAPSDLPHVKALNLNSTNTTGLIAIEVPSNPNGILRRFKIIYNPVGTGHKMPIQLDVGMNELMTTNLENELLYYMTNLESNHNYSVSVMACTVNCSDVSEPAFLRTKFGSTNLTKSPSIYYDDETFIISWEIPEQTGGPLDHFEVAIRRNGEFISPDEPYRVDVKSGQSKYEYKVHMQCDSNTNLSVAIRAVSMVNGELLFGNWSPEGSLSCSGVAAWILWLIGLGVVAILAIVAGILSKTLYKKWFECIGVSIKLPFELELDGVQSGTKKRRQNSGGDTHSLGKENMIYKLAYLAQTQSDESKDFLPMDSSKEVDEGASPSPSKPLLDSIHYADDELDDQHDDDGGEDFIHQLNDETELEHYKKLAYKPEVSRPDEDYHRHYATPKVQGTGGRPTPPPHQSRSVGTPTPSPSSRSHSSNSSSSSGSRSSGGSSSKEESHPNKQSPSQSTSATSMTPPVATIPLVQDDDGGGGGVGGGVGGTVPAKVPITNPYITWTYLKNDPVTGEGDISLIRPPYYQVGITMESN